MDKFKQSIASLLLLCVLVTGLFGCADNAQHPRETTQIATEASAPTESVEILDEVDYADRLKLDRSSPTAKLEVTVKSFIDGDTTHFYVPESVMPNGVLKGRYLAVNTPESTGKIEEYGKKASAFTKEKLSQATSIIIESESTAWDADSTGDRYLVWVWYKTADSADYRNLNVEILQNGLAIANKSSQNRYGETCVAALNQARALKLNVHSGQKDPDFYYGEAVELTLKELRVNAEQYNGMKVAFHGVVTMNNSNTIYVEAYDPETDMYHGMAVYYGFNLSGPGLDVISVGNEVRIVGSLQYYEAGGTWQVSDLNYRMMKPDDPNNIQKLSQGHEPAYRLTDPDTFLNGKVTIETEESTVTADYAMMALGTSLEMKGLTVKDVYTTDNGGSSDGAMTLVCEVNGLPISVRTGVLLDENGELITEDSYLGRVIDVKGIVDYFNGTYQIKVFTKDNITVIN